ncbi:MAG: hypothetical protein AAF790_09555, partial [Planctomycetota bacterium]
MPSHAAVVAARSARTGWGRHAVLNPGLRTLRQAAEAVLVAQKAPALVLTPAERRWLIGEVIAEADSDGAIPHFSRVEDRSRLSELLDTALADFARTRGVGRRALPAGDAPQQELAELDTRYRRLLRQHRLHDDQERLLAAAKMLESGESGALDLSHGLLACGLVGLSPLELDLLAAMLRRTPRAVVVLPWQTDANDDAILLEAIESYSKQPHTPWHSPASEVQALRARLPGAACRLASRQAAAGNSEAGRLGRWLFRDPRHAPPWSSDTQARYRLIAADGAQDEVDRVAADVKRCLLRGVAADDVLIACRRPGDFAGRAATAFADAGVPLAIDHALRPDDAGVAGVLGTAVHLATGDWRREALLSLITTPAATLFDQPRAAANAAA